MEQITPSYPVTDREGYFQEEGAALWKVLNNQLLEDKKGNDKIYYLNIESLQKKDKLYETLNDMYMKLNEKYIRLLEKSLQLEGEQSGHTIHTD